MKEKQLFLHSLLLWWKLLKFPHFQNGLWRFRTGKAAELFHGGASTIYRHYRGCWRRQLSLHGVPQSRSEASGTATSHSWSQGSCTDTSEQTTWAPVAWPTRRLRWELSSTITLKFSSCKNLQRQKKHPFSCLDVVYLLEHAASTCISWPAVWIRN